MSLPLHTVKQLENLRELLIALVKTGAQNSDTKTESKNEDILYCADQNIGVISEAIQNAPHLDVLPDHILQGLRNIMDVLSDFDTVYILAHELYYSSEETLNKLNVLDCFHVMNCYTNFIKNNELKPLKIANTIKTQYNWQSRLMQAIDKTDKRQLTDARLLQVGVCLLNELGNKNPFYNGINHNIENAEKVFKRITKKNTPVRTYCSALLLFHRGKYFEAIKLANEIVDNPFLPDAANPNFLLARCYLAMHQIEEALDHLKMGYELKDFDCIYELAVVLFQIEEIEPAIKILRKYAQYNREAAFQYYLLCKQGIITDEDAQSARTYLNRAKNFGDPRAMHEIGKILEKEGNYQEAVEYFEAAKLCNFVPAVIRLIDLYTNKAEVCDLKKAIENHLFAARRNNTMERLYVADQLWHGKSGFVIDREEAKVHYDLALVSLLNLLKDPDSTTILGGIHYSLAVIYLSEYKNDLTEALKHCEIAIKQKHPEARKMKHDILKKIKLSKPIDETFPEDVVEETEEIEEKKPLTIDELIDQAYQYNFEGNYADAITNWKRILKLNYNPMMRIKCLYGVGYNYICWSKRGDAPARALQIAQRKFEKILAIILIAFNHPKTTQAELEELEFWQQAVIEEAQHLHLKINVEEDTRHHDLKPQSLPAPTTFVSPPAIEAKVEAALTKTKAKLELSPGTLFVIEKLKAKGYRTLVVGGAVRDHLLNRPIKDYDLITRCPLHTVFSLFQGKATIVGRQHPIIIVEHDGEKIEIGSYQSIVKDYQNRDFRINAFYYDPDTHAILSFSNTMDDIRNLSIQTIGDPDKSFNEVDPVRMLRAINLKAKTRFNLEPKTEEALIRNLPKLTTVNPDRLFNEFLKLLINPNNTINLKLLHHYQILENFLPLSAAELLHPSKATQTALEDASTDKKINPALLLAIILWPAFNEKLRNCERRAEALEKMIKEVLDKQCQHLSLPEKFYNRIRCIWRMYLMMKNIYKSPTDTKSIRFADYLLTREFFRYLNAREFSLNPNKIRNDNEFSLMAYTSATKKFIHAINSNNYKKATELMAQNQDMYLRSANKSNWLHLAASTGSVQMMGLFVKLPGYLNTKDTNLQTPLHYTAIKGHVEGMQYLIAQGANVAAIDHQAMTILHLAAERGQIQAVEFVIKHHPELLTTVCNDKQTALHIAVKARQYHIVKLLLAYIDPEMSDQKGQRAVDYAVNDENYKDLPTIINAAKTPVKIPSQLSYKALKKCNIALMTGLSDTTLEHLKRNLLQHKLFSSNACPPAVTDLKPVAPNQN